MNTADLQIRLSQERFFEAVDNHGTMKTDAMHKQI